MTPRNRAAQAAKTSSPPPLPVHPPHAAQAPASAAPASVRSTTHYDLAISLVETLSDANPSSSFGIVLPRRKTVFDLLHRNYDPAEQPVFHLVTPDEACLHELLEEFCRGGRPNGWEALLEAFTTTSPAVMGDLASIRTRVDITLTTVHVNAWGERSLVWTFPSTRSGGRIPKLEEAQLLVYDRIRRLLVPSRSFPAA